jgi:endonuclease/exonuclease/phosphatase (EEP) superfamily protein YafD
LQHLVITAACMLCLQVLLILFSGFHPWLELGVHFVMHGLLAALVIMPILWITKHQRTAAVCMLVAAYFIFLLRPWIFLFPEAQPQAEAVRVMSWNVWATNNDLDEIERVIRRADPDILVLIEVRPNLVEQVPYLATQFPNSQVLPHWGGMGIGVFSKRPDVEFSVERFVIKMMPSIVTTIKSSDGTRSVELVGMHTFSPRPPQRALVRDQQIDGLASWAAERTGPICLVGDLNTTPWSRSFQRLEKIGFRDSRIGTGNCASWPSWLGSLGIPIDHALTLGSCSVTNRRVITDVRGSDHFPIQFDLSF